jgi:hypothetical protein
LYGCGVPPAHSTDHKDISTETTLLNYNYKEHGTIAVILSNLTRGTITIPQKAIICEVQTVTIETQSTPNSDENIKLLEEVDITKSDLNLIDKQRNVRNQVLSRRRSASILQHVLPVDGTLSCLICWCQLMQVYAGCIYCLEQQALHADR